MLSSPYGECGLLQTWYRNDTAIGAGISIIDTPLQNAKYMLVVGEGDTCVSSVLLTNIAVSANCNLENVLVLPNAISANGDGLNDVWQLANPAKLVALGISIKEVAVYNRLGNKVYSGASNNFAWQPNISSTSDVYYYYIKYADNTGKAYVKRGDISVLR